jgi:hypothetical protein
VLPLPSFYVRWATPPQPNSSPLNTPPTRESVNAGKEEGEEEEKKQPTVVVDGEKKEEEEGEEEMEWVHRIKEEDLAEADIERLMRELLKLHGEGVK